MNKVWCKPQLVVLVRGQVDEAVLFVCKTSVIGQTSSSAFNGCVGVPPSVGLSAPCNACQDIVTS